MADQMDTTVVETPADASKKIVKNYMWWSMGAGLIPVPLVDMAAVTGVQMKMVADISKEYDVKFSENRSRSIIISLLGSLVPNAFARGFVGSLLKALPLVGTIAGTLSMSLFSGAATYAIGQVFVQHFELGGTLLDFDADKMKAYFEEQFKEGTKKAEELKKEKA
ncbi:DUF697 domain-containing protein [bacterium]|nr:DUF697 domain-containing protein [bacterium]